MFEVRHYQGIAHYCISKFNGTIPHKAQEQSILILIQFLTQQSTYEKCRAELSLHLPDLSSIDYAKRLLDISLKKKCSSIKRHTKKMKLTSFGKEKGNKNRAARHWTAEEDDRLLSSILKYGLSSWHNVSKFVGNNRSKAQCSQRWSRGLDPTIFKGPWSEDDDKHLIELIHTYGDKAWKKIASCMGNRSDAQCKYRYTLLTRGKLGKTCKDNLKVKMQDNTSSISSCEDENEDLSDLNINSNASSKNQTISPMIYDPRSILIPIPNPEINIKNHNLNINHGTSGGNCGTIANVSVNNYIKLNFSNHEDQQSSEIESNFKQSSPILVQGSSPVTENKELQIFDFSDEDLIWETFSIETKNPKFQINWGLDSYYF
ncbi:Myb-like DNA-binding domain containing protein [Tritrichomonas foetus]|uniref:Myb-like DNA-binding domain containing protein n=1 Tax=Tritrichomonas foetus TaxID=1144522 RepID=A0A1J4JAW8_9EUKA|nr:Myb-like DNA-binding domain containing protein [Tritrichomonas foetus]|eukprot:OHS96330.1 Myb-like DNA-binding domain containing protein [Tritrichomonas foetus]